MLFQRVKSFKPNSNTFNKNIHYLSFLVSQALDMSHVKYYGVKFENHNGLIKSLLDLILRLIIKAI